MRGGCTIVLLMLGTSTARADVEAWRQRVAAQTQPDIAQALAKAPELKVEEVCKPVRFIQRQGAADWVLNPDGQSWDLIRYYYKEYIGPHALLIADFGSNAVRVDAKFPMGNIHASGSLVASDGKLYRAIGANGQARVFVYDPAVNAWSATKMVLPGLGVGAEMTTGTDGQVYALGQEGKGAKRARLFRLDLAKETAEDMGQVGPECQFTLGVAADDQFVYLLLRRGARMLIALNKQTKEETKLLQATLEGVVALSQLRHGCCASATKLNSAADKRNDYWLYHGHLIEHTKRDKLSAPWRAQDAADGPPRKLPPKPEVLEEKLDPDPEGTAELWYRYRPEEAWKKLRFTVPLFPIETHRVLALPDGRIWGNSDFYHGEFVYDPKTNQSRHLARSVVCYAGAAVFHDGMVYTAGYPSGKLAVFDMTRPVTWRQLHYDGMTKPEDKELNPRALCVLRQYANMHHVNDAAVGADGKIYFAGNSYRDSERGALTWWDPKTETGGGLWKPLSNVALSYVTPVAKGRRLVLSVWPRPDTELRKPTPNQAKLMVYDVIKGEITREIEPIEGSRWLGPILALDDRRILGLGMHPDDETMAILYGLDSETGEVAFRKAVPRPAETFRPHGAQSMHLHCLCGGPDKKDYLFIQERLVRIDPENACVEVLGKAGPAGDLAFQGNDLYIGGAPALRRIRDAVHLTSFSQ
jgi:hypothetical protein